MVAAASVRFRARSLSMPVMPSSCGSHLSERVALGENLKVQAEPWPRRTRLLRSRELAAGSDPDPTGNNPAAHLRAEKAATLRARVAREI